MERFLLLKIAYLLVDILLLMLRLLTPIAMMGNGGRGDLQQQQILNVGLIYDRNGKLSRDDPPPRNILVLPRFFVLICKLARFNLLFWCQYPSFLIF